MTAARIEKATSGIPSYFAFAAARLLPTSVIAVIALVGLSLALDARAGCREATASVLPMPTWTWLRSWRADLAAPTRLATDSVGRVFVTDPVRGQVVSRNAAGAIAGRKKNLGSPTSIAVDASGGILLGDRDRGSVTLYDNLWNIRHALGVGDGEFGLPGDIAVDPASGEIYVSDTARHVVAVYSAAGLLLRTLGAPAPSDGLPAADGLFRTPTGIAIAGEELLVADQLNFRVQAFDKTSGAYLYCIGNYSSSSFFAPASGPARTLGMPQGLWVDRVGRLYVADAYQGQIRVIDRSNGAIIGSIGTQGDDVRAMRVPSDVLIDAKGRLFVASTNSSRIDIFGLDAYTDPERIMPSSARLVTSRIKRSLPPTQPIIEAFIEIPGYRAIDVNPATIRVNGLPATLLEAADSNGNNIPELHLAISAATLLPTLGSGNSGQVRIGGNIGALRFETNSTISIVNDLPPPVITPIPPVRPIPPARPLPPVSPVLSIPPIPSVATLPQAGAQPSQPATTSSAETRP